MQNEDNFRRSWTRSETRQVRPFRHLEDYLKETSLRLHDDDEFSTDPRIHKGRVDISRLEPVIRTALPPDNLEEKVGISDKSLRFIILVEDGFLKTTGILFESSLDEAADGCIALPPDQARRVATWSTETKVHVAVILAQDHESAPGVATRQGSWLAKRTFEIVREISVARLPVDPVEREWFVRNGLPADTTYFVEIFDTDFGDSTAELQEMVSIKVNKSLVEALERDQNSLTSRAIVSALYTDVVTRILSDGFSEGDGNPHPNSPLCNAVTRIADRTGISAGQLVDWAQRAEDGKLRAAVQAETGLTRALISAARRRAV